MTTDKAIEILTDILLFVKPGNPPDEHDAITLGRDALKAIQALRRGTPRLNLSILPGETKD